MQTLIDTINKVKEFHHVFGLEYHETPQAQLSVKIINLRYNLMKEENERLKGEINAIRNNDKDLEGKISEIRGERELLIEKVQKILEKVERVEI